MVLNFLKKSRHNSQTNRFEATSDASSSTTQRSDFRTEAINSSKNNDISEISENEDKIRSRDINRAKKALASNQGQSQESGMNHSRRLKNNVNLLAGGQQQQTTNTMNQNESRKKKNASFGSTINSSESGYDGSSSDNFSLSKYNHSHNQNAEQQSRIQYMNENTINKLNKKLDSNQLNHILRNERLNNLLTKNNRAPQLGANQNHNHNHSEATHGNNLGSRQVSQDYSVLDPMVELIKFHSKSKDSLIGKIFSRTNYQNNDRTSTTQRTKSRDTAFQNSEHELSNQEKFERYIHKQNSIQQTSPATNIFELQKSLSTNIAPKMGFSGQNNYARSSHNQNNNPNELFEIERRKSTHIAPIYNYSNLHDFQVTNNYQSRAGSQYMNEPNYSNHESHDNFMQQQQHHHQINEANPDIIPDSIQKSFSVSTPNDYLLKKLRQERTTFKSSPLANNNNNNFSSRSSLKKTLSRNQSNDTTLLQTDNSLENLVEESQYYTQNANNNITQPPLPKINPGLSSPNIQSRNQQACRLPSFFIQSRSNRISKANKVQFQSLNTELYGNNNNHDNNNVHHQNLRREVSLQSQVTNTDGTENLFSPNDIAKTRSLIESAPIDFNGASTYGRPSSSAFSKKAYQGGIFRSCASRILRTPMKHPVSHTRSGSSELLNPGSSNPREGKLFPGVNGPTGDVSMDFGIHNMPAAQNINAHTMRTASRDELLIRQQQKELEELQRQKSLELNHVIQSRNNNSKIPVVASSQTLPKKTLLRSAGNQQQSSPVQYNRVKRSNDPCHSSINHHNHHQNSNPNQQSFQVHNSKIPAPNSYAKLKSSVDGHSQHGGSNYTGGRSLTSRSTNNRPNFNRTVTYDSAFEMSKYNDCVHAHNALVKNGRGNLIGAGLASSIGSQEYLMENQSRASSSNFWGLTKHDLSFWLSKSNFQ